MNNAVSQRRRVVPMGAGEKDRIYFVQYLKRALRDLGSLNRDGARVYELIESVLGPEPKRIDLNPAERRFLLDVVTILNQMLQDWWESNPEVIRGLQEKLNDLALQYDVVPA